MAVNLLKKAVKKAGIGVTNHVLEFAKQTALGGPKYFANRGTLTGGEDAKTGKAVSIKMSIFDRLVSSHMV